MAVLAWGLALVVLARQPARSQQGGHRFRQDWGTRIAGGLLVVAAGFALWIDLGERIALRCA